MNLTDALFNWLQIKLVSEGRPEDLAAKETLDFFEIILREDHQLSDFGIAEKDRTMIHLHYTLDGKTKRHMINRELAENLLIDINSNPKYNQNFG